MEISFITYEGLFKLKEEVEKNANDNCYSTSNKWVEDKYSSFIRVYSKASFNDVKLKFTKGNDDDEENMITFYEAFKGLTRSQATDERIWVGLCHTYFWDYMQKRWPIDVNSSKIKKDILNSYFFTNGLHAYFLNGLSRLWWYADYTYDETLEDPYEFTKYACRHDLNGKIYPLLSCNYAKNKTVFLNILKSIKKFEEENQIVLNREQFNDLKSYLHRLNGVVFLDILSFEELDVYITRKLSELNKRA